MKNTLSSKGLIPIALTFVLIIAFILAAIIGYFWSKSPYTVELLKRSQAINCAEAGLYEAFNRFRTGSWDADGWAAGTSVPADPTVDVDGVPVTILVELEGGRNKVSATVRYGDIGL